jgi:hypothetical protein
MPPGAVMLELGAFWGFYFLWFASVVKNREERIDWIFISTHSEKLHHDCRDWLVPRGWVIVADANLNESYSVDGLLVAHRPGLHAPLAIDYPQRDRLLTA